MNNGNITEDSLNKIPGKVLYPKMAFAFNPVRITLKDLDPESIRSVTLASANGISIKGELKNGSTSLSFDVSAVAKSLFNKYDFYKVEQTDKTLYKVLQFSIVNTETSGNYYTGYIPVLWGALQVGEVYSQNKTLTYFRGYPFTVPVFASQNVLLKGNGNFIGGEFLKGKYNLPISTLEASSVDTSRDFTVEIYPYEAEEYEDENGDIQEKIVKARLFDYTFDYTFGVVGLENHGVSAIRVKSVECPNEGAYLRWINKHGEYNYYLFQYLNQSDEVADSKVDFDPVFDTIDYTDNYHFGTTKQIGKEIQEVADLYASLIDEEEYKIVKGLVHSPVVDLFMGYDDGNNPLWTNVNIKAGTFAHGRDHLRDFNFSMLLPKTQVQQL